MAALHWILLSRAPIAGQTKTRLAAEIGPEEARRFHVACLEQLIAESGRFVAGADAARGVAGLPRRRHLFITPPGSRQAFVEAGVGLPPDLQLHDQHGATLGARMAQAISTVLCTAPGPALGTEPGAESGAALLTGSDLPLVTANHLQQAAALLATADLVLGAAEDGGYWLIGMKAPAPALFELAEWGGPTVLERTIAAAAAQGLRVARMETLPDADTLADLRRIAGHPGFGSIGGGRAAAVIRRLVV
ncbi:MAG: TIGR04282 family arsenosugar biosynthesis glycosyltransferase [Candidatus Lambdaproteobacteria bacterium]|nr:TIGR04282 family arsenosugar biosynthesis glycosyltransferase [Candidatus Lambdaproteobacteria bacterium]